MNPPQQTIEQKPKPEFSYSIKEGREAVEFLRGDQVILRYERTKKLEEFMKNLCTYMNRDRRPIVYLEDRIFSLKGIVDNLVKMVQILNSRLKTVAHKDHKDTVKEWIATSEDLLKEAREESR